jgi:hypothetical protein
VQRFFVYVGEAFAQLLGHRAEQADQPVRWHEAQVPVVEMPAQLLVAGRCPLGSVSRGEAFDDPPQLREGMARGLDVVLERGPARHPVFAGDGQLGLVECGELPGGEAAFRLELQVAEARPFGERTRLIGQGSPSLGARGSATSGRKKCRRSVC